MERLTTNGKRMARLPIAAAHVFGGPEAAPAAPTQTDILAQIEALNRTFAEFREKNDRAIAEVRAGRADAVTTEHVDRINTAITEQQRTVEAMAAELRAARLTGTSQNGSGTPAQARYLEAFRAAMRSPSAPGHLEALREAAAAIGGPQAALYSGSDPDGGFFLPVEVDAEITRLQGLISPMRSVADVRTTTAPEQRRLHNLGGAASGWVQEKSTRSETATPELSELKFPVFEIYAEPHATQTILDDAGQRAEQWLASEVVIAFGEKEGDAWVRGDGMVRPRGFTDYPKVANASWTWGKMGYLVSGVAAALSDGSNNGHDALINVVYGTKARYRAVGQWMMNDLTQAAVRKLKDSQGAYLWQPSVQAGQPATLLGYPVVTDDNMDDIGAGKFPAAFGDWKSYRIVDRIGVRVLPDPYTRKPYVKFYTTKRVGGGVQDFQGLKLLKIGTS